MKKQKLIFESLAAGPVPVLLQLPTNQTVNSRVSVTVTADSGPYKKGEIIEVHPCFLWRKVRTNEYGNFTYTR